MKIICVSGLLAFAVSVHSQPNGAVQSDLLTLTNRHGRIYERVRLQKFNQEMLLWFSESGSASGSIKISDLPDEFQKQFGFDPAQVAQGEFARAVAAGLFRKVNGIVYDLRKPQPGWVSFKNVKLVQQLPESDNAALVDPHPDMVSLEVIHVKNLKALSDTERFSFRAMPVGSFSYINKKGNERIVRSYDAGRACPNNEVPGELQKGELASAPTETPHIEIDNGTGLPVGWDATKSKPPSASSDGIEPVASGSGFFITEDGYLVTNDHVVRGAKKIRIRTRTQTADAELVKSSKTFDLALLKVVGKFKALPLDFDHAAGLGETVFTIGFPNPDVQGSEPKYTDGKVSSLSGAEDDSSQYQVSIPVQPGNSGGPLVTENGAVIGVVRAKLNDLAALVASGNVPQSVNYAVKAKYIRDLLEPVPGLLSAIKRPLTKAKSDDAIKATEQAVAIVLVY